MNKGFYSFLGLCQRAGKIVSGETGVNNEIKRGKIRLLILAEDLSDNTKNSYLRKTNRNFKVIIAGSKEDLGLAIGKSYRGLIGVMDNNMAKNLMDIYEKNKIGGEARV